MLAKVRRYVDVREFMRKDPVLMIALAFALLSCIAVPPDAGYLEYVDVRTLGMLFSLMAVMAGLTRAGVFSALCRRLLAIARGPRRLCLTLVLLAFFSSMLITNDVALVTFVPLALLALRTFRSEQLTCFTVALMTVAANLGSMATPVGNPQNLYLYSVSHMALGDFLLLMLPYALAALVLLAVVIWACGKPNDVADGRDTERHASHEDVPAGMAIRRILPWLAVFALALLSVARVLPFEVPVAAAALVGVAFDRATLRHVDYGLLLTFVAFFVFVGNVGRIGAVSALIAQMVTGHELIVSVAASQVLSNVPAAILLSGFTDAWSALIVGTNIGGLGTLIASMASLISYKQLALVLPHAKGRYMKLFTAWNIVFLMALGVLAALLSIVTLR